MFATRQAGVPGFLRGASAGVRGAAATVKVVANVGERIRPQPFKWCLGGKERAYGPRPVAGSASSV